MNQRSFVKRHPYISAFGQMMALATVAIILEAVGLVSDGERYMLFVVIYYLLITHNLRGQE